METPHSFEHNRAPEAHFTSSEEELAYLREKVAGYEKEEQKVEGPPRYESASSRVVNEYKQAPTEDVLHESFRESPRNIEALNLELAPESHDQKMLELLSLTEEKGIKNTLRIIKKMDNPHVEDDFHRFLVQYIGSGYDVPGLKEKTPISRTLHMKLFEVILPAGSSEERAQRGLTEMLSSMEQFYQGMISIVDEDNKGQNHFTIELAQPDLSEELSFYVSLPEDKQELFEKQILSIYPEARLIEKKDDYNIFNEEGASVASVATSKANPIFPLATYDQFEHDPLNVLVNSFSKIDRDGEGAAIQIVINSERGAGILDKYKHALSKIKKGTPVKEATDISYTIGEEFYKGFKDFFKSGKKDVSSDQSVPDPADEQAMEEIGKKISSPIFTANIRLVASSRTEAEAVNILSDMESAFHQFENTKGNGLSFSRLTHGKLQSLFKSYAFRTFSSKRQIPLSAQELTTLMHFQNLGLKGASQIKEAHGSTAPAPLDGAESGLLLGVNRHRNRERNVYMKDEDRLRHFYVIGQTGTGKTSLMKNMITQDIKNGEGVCFIDPHGADVQDILAQIPRERFEDVIYFDPSYTARPMPLNMLEYDPAFPEQKTFVINELFSIFQKLYSNVPESMGPMFEQYFRNATALVIDDPESGSTLLDISRVLADQEFRELKLSRCTNPVVKQFWEEVAGKAGGEASLQNIVPYITSKFDVFLSNEIMRPIIAQQHSAFNFRDLMDNRKILLVNLSKGKLGDMNAHLLGLILVGKILMATLSRVDSYGTEMPPFYLYIDEFQNVTTDSISTILSEARKYKLSLNIAHQYIAQLDEGIRDSVFGNVGSVASFRVGSDDAEYLERQFDPVFSAKDLMSVDNYNAYVRMLVDGQPKKPFSIETIPPTAGVPQQVDKLKQLSFLKYGGNRENIERAIMEKYQKTKR